MPAQVWKKPIDVGNRLDKLFKLKKEHLLEVVEAMVRAKADCTPNDPPGSLVWSAYKMGTRRLREITLSEAGWEKDDTDQIPSVINKALGVRIAVANTDDATGLELESRIPQNRAQKGAATDRVVHANQLSFVAALDESLKVVSFKKAAPPPPQGIVTWYLCTYCEGEEFRAEISAPKRVDDGYFDDFYDRIILTDGEDGDGAEMVRRHGGNDGPEFEIPVTRKSKK